MLKGKNVRLRAVERDDLKRLHALEQNVDLVLLGDGHWEPGSLARWEKQFDKNLDQDDPAWFVIEADDRVIGTIGLHHRNRRESTTQFGIGIYDPEYVGRGYGREAIMLLLEWAFNVQNWRRVWLDTVAVNERAIRAYRACGFVEEGRLREHCWQNGEYVDMVLMGQLRSDWEARDRR